MEDLQLSRQSRGARRIGAGTPIVKLITTAALASAMVLSMSTVAAQADEVDLTPGPTIVADPNSPTGYTGHFVYCNPEATSVTFAADIMLRNWEDPTDTKVYTPFEYEPGLMRGGGGYEVAMTDAGNGCWYTEVPLAAGANQYWFYVNGNRSLWVADPENSPIFAPDGLQGTARRAFNKVHVPYDPVKQNYAPLAAREIENPRVDSPKGTWSYVPIDIPNQTGRTIGVYLPPDYDPNRAEPYKTIYMQHGGGQDQSDWMNMGDVPVIMDNLLQDGTTEPAVVITTNTNYLGPVGNQAVQGDAYPNLRNVVIPFVEANYHVSTDAIDRAFAGLSAGSFVTQNLIRDDADLFGYYGPWSGGVSVPATTPNLAAPYILYGGGAWDFGLPNATTVATLDEVGFIENVVVSGAHDFNAWNQLFTIWARDYLWHPEAFILDEVDTLKAAVAATSLNKGNLNALTVKLDQALKLVTNGENDGAIEVLNGFVTQVTDFQAAGKLTEEQAAALVQTAEKLLFNLGYWQ
jgi:hypothetical protein